MLSHNSDCIPNFPFCPQNVSSWFFCLTKDWLKVKTFACLFCMPLWFLWIEKIPPPPPPAFFFFFDTDFFKRLSQLSCKLSHILDLSECFLVIFNLLLCSYISYKMEVRSKILVTFRFPIFDKNILWVMWVSYFVQSGDETVKLSHF